MLRSSPQLIRDIFNCLWTTLKHGVLITLWKWNESNTTYDFDYHVEEIVLRRINWVSNLGMTVNSTLSPAEHIDLVGSMPYAPQITFIFRSTRDFRSRWSLLVPYRALVMACIVSDPVPVPEWPSWVSDLGSWSVGVLGVHLGVLIAEF